MPTRDQTTKKSARAAAPPAPRRRRRQAERNAETRLKLLTAAARTIFEIGYSRASIGEIVKRAGLTKGAHLHHFQTKEQLIASTIEHLFAEVRAKQEPLVSQPSAPAEVLESRLEQAAANAFDWRFVALLEIWMAARTEPQIHSAFAEHEARHAATRRHWFEDVIGADALDESDVMDVVGGFNFLLRGLFLQQILGGDWRTNPTWRYWRREVARELERALSAAAAVRREKSGAPVSG